MDWSYYLYLYPAYAFGLLAWHFSQRHRAVVPDAAEPGSTRPAFEFLLVILAVVGTILIGQVYQADYLLPESGSWRPLTGAINQVLIFAPILALVPFRGQPWTSAWIPAQGRGRSILWGLGIAIAAILLHLGLRGLLSRTGEVLLSVYHPKNFHLMVQVLLEDLAIAIAFVRLQQWIGKTSAMIVVGSLFALAHIPAMLAEGFQASQLIGLSLDAGLTIAVLWVLSYHRNILWLWMLHYAMDMMQFVE